MTLPTALVVVTHPVHESNTWQVAAATIARLRDAGYAVECADLHAEGFNPVITAEDLEHYAGVKPVAADVAREQERVERADLLVMVSPMYWWSVSALMRGWIDRVFTDGWAFGHRSGAATLPVDRAAFVILSSSDTGLLERHRYAEAAHIQLTHGVLGYCRAEETPLLILSDSEESFDDLAPEWLPQLDDYVAALSSTPDANSAARFPERITRGTVG